MKKGDKFRIKGLPKIYTAACFFGNTGIEYNTEQEARNNNEPKTIISVKNKEFGGGVGMPMVEKVNVQN